MGEESADLGGPQGCKALSTSFLLQGRCWYPCVLCGGRLLKKKKGDYTRR